ncbi:myelin regulatory factor-like isoform X2 [Dreissena polymorpha]|uniref:myelin regulatory factor-like isoform X2 n=1 Tax=Dreissena polymorpha TaxID=45954 RepID=UPI002264E306|nr:myelin regulatory factor-like isoform X2 [Dreissena polymorpha]
MKALMDILPEDPTFRTVFDHDLGIEENGPITLDNFDLEKFINDDVCMPEDPISAIAYNSHPHHYGNGFRINNIHLRGPTTGPCSTGPTNIPGGNGGHGNQTEMYMPRQTLISTRMPYIDSGQITNLTLPDSPPDSEPYSPPDGHRNGLSNHNGHSGQGNHSNGHNGQGNHSNQQCNGHQNGHSMHSNQSPMNNNQPNTQQDNSKYTTTSSTMHSHMYGGNPHHQPAVHGLPPKGLVAMAGYHQEGPLPHGLPHQHSSITPLTLNLTPHTGPNMNTQQILTPGNLSPQSKKRKHVDSPNSAGMSGPVFNSRNGLLQNIKQEPNTYANPGYLQDQGDDEYSNYGDPNDSSNGYDNGVYQVIKWNQFQKQTWVTLTDVNLKDLPGPQYRVDADKGFNISTSDESFVCQKKNHFQITCHVCVSGEPKYVRTPEGVKKIDHFCLHFYGVKLESPSQTIKIEQSQSDRSKKPFKPVRLDLIPEQVSKLTVGRLHFSETTSNNMRKKGRPNPDQRYFMLVVALHAHSGENSYMVTASASEKIIVRASNPGQFDSDIETQHWSKGSLPESVYHIGRVGVNTDHPEEALTVHGNIKLSGQILHTSDIRAKQDLEEVDSKEQLKKVSGIKLYNYKYSKDYADHVGIPEHRRRDTGVIAQEIQEVLPDAVIDTGDVRFENGAEIKNLLVVNKDRIFMENVGAVKELCKLTDNLEVRIDELEKMNSKLSKLKRFDSLKSTVSSKSSCSTATVSSTAPPRKSYTSSSPEHRTQPKSHHKSHHHCSKAAPPPPVPAPHPQGWCSNRFIQITIIILICVMAFCLIAITILYILERQKDNQGPAGTTINNHFHGNSGGSTNMTDIPPKTSRPTIIPEDPTTVSVERGDPPTVLAPCETSATQQCTKQCPCTSHDQGVDVTGYIAFLHDIQRRKYPPDVPYAIETTSKEPMPLENRTSKDPIPEVIINPLSQYPEVKVPYEIHTAEGNNEPAGGPYRVYRKRRDTPQGFQLAGFQLNFLAEITIPELNFTLNNSYLDPMFSMDNNMTYNIPYSQYFDSQTQYTLSFTVASGQEVHLCRNGHEEDCTGNSDSEIPMAPIALQWKLPIGRFKTSFLRFKVTTEGMQNNRICNAPIGEDATEYNLLFTRICLN